MSPRALPVSLLVAALAYVLAIVHVHGRPATTISPARLPIFREAEDSGDASKPTATAVDERALIKKAKSKVRPSRAVISDARLMKEFRDISRSDNCKRGVFTVELVEDDLYEWEVRLTFKDSESELHEDLLMLEGIGQDYVVLRISYGYDYPASPPFVRVVHPILRNGFVHDGGALCMELLTKHGWVPNCTSESLILSVQAQLLEGNARVNGDPSAKEIDEYFSNKRAKERFAEMERDHGWDKRP